MRIVRLGAWLSTVAVLLLTGSAPAWAAPHYPPTTPPADTGVLGTKTGHVSNSGLPHTGFDPRLLWIAVALIVVGVLLVAGSRARRARRWPQ